MAMNVIGDLTLKMKLDHKEMRISCHIYIMYVNWSVAVLAWSL